MKHKILKTKIWVIWCLLSVAAGFAQQDPQFTYYMYNTVSVNPAYAGQRDGLSIIALNRAQWVGLEGAPNTQTISLHSPLRNERLGLGLTAINDNIGPLHELHIQSQFSYTVQLNRKGTKLSFGINAGFLNIGSAVRKGKAKNNDIVLSNDYNYWSPLLGTGAYLHNTNWYLGLATPNLLFTKQDDIEKGSLEKRIHFIGIGGFVFEPSKDFKIKPAFLFKAVRGAPIIVDASLNFLIHESFTLGAAWRWNDALSILAGFQINKNFFVGYAYDTTTTRIKNYSNGSHEVVLRYEISKIGKILSPRFF